ncbi:hypothetical protein AB0230_01720 [Microbacterium sp. NPDC089190]|uniref:hypothetical protein n=1 Tax=Microbacterium sp. NPDC089190 TaxID=3155063 RepID=UPI00344D1EB4
MSKRKCVSCGKDPAEGFASVYRDGKEQWYCHPDDGESCYVGGSSEPTMGELAKWLRRNPGPQQVAGFTVKYVGSFPYADDWRRSDE